jgi:hypothetical protein
VTSDRSGASTGVSLAARFIALRAEQASLTKAHRECRGRCEALERALKEARARARTSDARSRRVPPTRCASSRANARSGKLWSRRLGPSPPRSSHRTQRGSRSS